MEYTDEFKSAVREDILNRIKNEDGFAEKLDSIQQELGDDDLLRQSAYEGYAKKPEFKKYLEQKQGFFSKLGDDLGNVSKAWNAGNFYSEGGWNDIAKNIINGGKPEDREALYQNYLKWEKENQMPENKTWVGDVVNGVANLVPLTLDMLPEAAAVAAATGAAGAAAGSVVPGLGTAAVAKAGAVYGFKGSMVEQSYKVGVADIYTTLRKAGVDDETAKSSALKWGTAYGALEYAGKGIAPVSRKILGGKILKEIIDKTVDKNVKNKLLAGAAKYGIDVLTTGTAESAIEGGQAAITEAARQGAAGEKTDVGAIARAGWDEAAAAAPAMYGMAAIGGGVERVGGRLRRDIIARKAEAADATKKTEEAAAGSNAAGGEAASGRGVSVPDGVPNGGVFLGGNGGFYRNVDGVPAPISDAEAAKILNQINQSNGEANGGLSGQGDNLNDNLNGLGGKLGGLDDKSEELAGGGIPDIVGAGELDGVAPVSNELADEVGEAVAGDNVAVFDDSQAPENVEQGAGADNREVGGGVFDETANGAKPNGETPKGGKLRSFEKRDFKGVKASAFKPLEWRKFEDYLATRDEKRGAAGQYGWTPEQRIAKVCPNFVDDAIKGARENGSYHLQNADRADLRIIGYKKSNKFKIIKDGQRGSPLKTFNNEAQARDFLQRYIYAAADAAKVISYPEAAVRGIFKDARGLSAEDAYVRDAAGEVSVDGIVIRSAADPEEVRESFRQMYGDAKNHDDADKAVKEVLGKRDFESMDEFKRWLEQNSDVVARKYDEIKDEYNRELDGEFERKWNEMGQSGAAEYNRNFDFEANLREFVRRQRYWLDNNVEDLARLYGAKIAGNGESEVKAMKSPLERFRKFTVDFKNGVDAFIQKRLPTNKALSFQLEEGALGKYGIPDLPVVMLYSTLSKVVNKHKIPAEIIKSLPDELKNAVAVFSYPKEANSFDLLIEPTMPDGRPIVVSLRKSDKIFDVEFKINEATTIHPKEHINRLAHWAQSGRLVYWDNERGRKYLQFRIPAYWGRLEEIFSTSVNAQSENTSESQGKNSEDNYKASFGAKNRRAEIEKTNRDFRELYERYKNGDQAAYEEAAKLVADYAKSKGYDVKVYHGTGADGFNVAKADASEEQNGEGAQAHGMGLYLATEKRTAEGYRDRARKPNPVVKINGKVVDAGKISKDLMLPELGIIEVLQRISNFGYDSQLKYLELQKKSAEDALKLAESGVDEFGYHLFEEEKTSRINRANEEIEFWQRDIDNLQRLVDWVKKNLGADITNDSHSISVKSPEGKVFDWLTNLKPENVIDEEKSLSEQPEIWEKLKKIWKTVVYPKIEKGLENDDSAAAHAQHYKPTNWIAGEAIVFGWGNFLGKTRFNKLMLEHGIRGITYDGQIDGRCYVSFEGGSAVKLQDPFTFDDNGELIPLSERFDEGNPDMRYSRGASGKASNGGKVGGGVSFESMVEEYAKLRELREKTVGEKPLTFIRPVSAMRSALPKSVRFNKASNRLEGVPSIGDIRRYMERVFNIPISNGLRKEVRQRGALGVYYNRLEAIRTLRGHVNDLDTVAHELGHYLETLFFGGKLASEEVKDFALAKELEGYCVERFGEFTYKGRERISEGWAQFISDVIKGDETVADRCPRAFSALSSALRESPRVNEAFSFICQMAELNANASPLQRVNANIRRRSDAVRKTAVDRLIESGRWFTRMWFDEYEGLERFQKDLERSGVSDEDGSRVIDLARNYAGGSVGQVNYSLTVNQIDLDGRVVGKSLRSILRDNLKTAYDKENIDAYLMCRRVVEYYKTEERRGERGGSRSKFGIDYADAVDVVSTATDGMRKCAEELDVYMRNDLKLLLDGGLINERVYATCLANKGYSPLQRYMEAIGDADSGGSGGGFANVAPALRAFKGSDREVISSLDSIAKNSRNFREMALKNRVAARVVGGINRGVGLGNWASPAPDRTQAVKLRTREYAEAILAYKEKMGDETPSSGRVRERKIEALERELKNDPVLACTIFRDEAKSDKANQIITVWSKGEKVAWQIHDKGLYEALAGMDNTASWFWETWLGQLLGGSARVLRAGATSAFQFTAGNLARDIQAATVFSNNGYVPIASALRHGLIPAAIGSAKRVGEAFGRDTSKWFKDSFLAENAKLYDEWVASGGAMATFAENGVQTAEEVSVDEMLARKSLAADWFEKFKRAPIKRTAELLATPFEGVSKFSEEVNRLTEFGLSKKNAIKRLQKERGLTAAQAREVWDGAEGVAMRRKAANDSKEITLNFSRGGRYGKQVNMVVPFFNAGMQGIFKYATDLNPVDWVRLCVALREANVSEMAASVKGRNAVKLAKVVAISAIAAALKAALYNGLDDDDKRKLDNLPDWRKRTYWTFCIGGVMYQIPKAQELAPFCAVFDKAAKAAYGIEQGAEGDVLPTSWDILSPSIVPQFAKPFIELYTNRNLFTGAELIPQTIRQNRLPSAQELPSTSATAKWISRLLAERGVEVSPIHLDWGVNTLFSSLGRWVVKNMGDRLAESVGGVPSSPEGMRSLASLTGLDKFIVPEYSASRYVQKFYEGKTEWAQIKGTVKKVSEHKLPARTWTPAQIRRAEWYEGRRDGVAMSREREINLVVKSISEINAAISAAKNSTELTPHQKRVAILDYKKKIDSLAENAYKELIYSEEKYRRWKSGN